MPNRTKTEGSITGIIIKHLAVLLPIGLVCGGLAWLFHGNTAPEFVPEATTKAMSLLATLLLIALFVERSIEVYVGALRAPEIAKLDANLSEATAELARAELRVKAEIATLERLEAEASDSVPLENRVSKALLEQQREKVSASRHTLAQISEEAGAAERARQAYSGETRRTTLLSGVFLGILVATVGPRILSEMTDPIDDLDTLRQWLFVSVDIFVTGGLIGGGADGIHKIISVATEKLDQIKNGIRAAA